MTNLPKVVTCKQYGKESDFSVVAVWLLLYYKFTAESVLKGFLKLLNIWQSYGEKVIASSALFTRALLCSKMNSLEIWCMVGRNCCNSIALWLILLTNLDSMINKCQTGVTPTTCYSPNDAISDWTLIVYTGSLSRHFFLGDWYAYNWSFCRFFSVFTVIILVNEQNDDNITTTTPQPFYSPFSVTTQVSRCQKRISGLYGARED